MSMETKEQNRDLPAEAKLGVLGGMGPQATQLFYQWLIDHTDASCDQEHIPTLILSDTQMPDRTAAILSGKTDAVYHRLLSDCQLLINAGCTAIAIPCNTSHFFADPLQEAISVPILHMPRLAAAEAARRLGGQKGPVAVLATDGTIQTGVYDRELEAMGLTPWHPDEKTQAAVMHLIYDVIKGGSTGTRGDFSAIDAAVRSAGCRLAILACTELSVYRQNHGLDNSFYLDAMEILVDECVRRFS